jgi:hypothetical protein
VIQAQPAPVYGCGGYESIPFSERLSIICIQKSWGKVSVLADINDYQQQTSPPGGGFRINTFSNLITKVSERDI